jgi:cell division septation protein DedD
MKRAAGIFRRSAVLLLLLAACLTMLHAQESPTEIRDAITKVENGQAEEVKRVLPDLAAKYQNNPGVLYLQGRLAADGIEGVKFYQSIVDNFPKSEYADAALYHIYQYYYALGLYRTAELKMQALRKDYPASRFVTGAKSASMPAVEAPAVRVRSKDDTASVATTPAEQTVAPPVVPPTAPAAEPARKAPYTLQTGAFSTSANAEKQKTFFEDKGLTVEVTNKVRGGRSLFLVWVGSYATADDARRFGREVRSKYNIDSIVVERY